MTIGLPARNFVIRPTPYFSIVHAIVDLHQARTGALLYV